MLHTLSYHSSLPKYHLTGHRTFCTHRGGTSRPEAGVHRPLKARLRVRQARATLKVKASLSDERASIAPTKQERLVACKAALTSMDVPEENQGTPSKAPRLERNGTMVTGAILVGMGLIWYGGNIYFNILNKQVLKAFMYPFTCTTIYLAVCGCAGVLGWMTGLLEKPKVTSDQLIAFLPMAAFHLLANVLIMISLGNVPVSFTHTIKACEPFVLVLTSALILGTRPSIPLTISLVPVVMGVSIASATELCFNWLGFLSAMASNLASALRNTYSKACLKDARGDLSSVNLLAILSMQSAIMMIPLALYMEGNVLAPAAVTELGLDWFSTIQKIVLAGGIMTLYQQVSYNILSKVSPVTHSVMNCLKRIAVIVASVLVFQNPVSISGGLGTALAIFGVLLYSSVKRWEGNKKKMAYAQATL